MCFVLTPPRLIKIRPRLHMMTPPPLESPTRKQCRRATVAGFSLVAFPLYFFYNPFRAGIKKRLTPGIPSLNLHPTRGHVSHLFAPCMKESEDAGAVEKHRRAAATAAAGSSGPQFLPDAAVAAVTEASRAVRCRSATPPEAVINQREEV